jgi:hypothetical protein
VTATAKPIPNMCGATVSISTTLKRGQNHLLENAAGSSIARSHFPLRPLRRPCGWIAS